MDWADKLATHPSEVGHINEKTVFPSVEPTPGWFWISESLTQIIQFIWSGRSICPEGSTKQEQQRGK